MTDFWNELSGMLQTPMMQRALIAAILVGITAPIVGTYLVQRRLSLLGDGIGHVALTGVALGWLVGSGMGLVPHDALAIPGAIVAATVGAIAIELVRERGKTNADVALALLFYGGIAGGVLLIGIAGGSAGNLMSYLFGSISTVTSSDIWVIAALAIVVMLLGVGLRPALFAIGQDEDFAKASGLPVRTMSIVIAVMSALTVTVAMRVVGLLLVSALMIVPVAIAQLVTGSFKWAMRVGVIIGLVVCVTGLVITYWHNVSPGATIVVVAILLYAVVAVVAPLVQARRRHRQRRDPHPDLPVEVDIKEA